VGPYLRDELRDHTDWDVINFHDTAHQKVDIRESSQVDSAIRSISPDIVFHLAGQSYVPQSIENPQETLLINTLGTLNLLNSLEHNKKKCIFVYISSSEVYGNQSPENLPLLESSQLYPMNPYSSSKISGEIYCSQYSRSSQYLEVKIARPFNHIGVGQNSRFVVPNFCKQIKESILSKSFEIQTGNLDSTRDFLDVRDVVQGYRLIAKNGKNGECYNVCSGKETSIQKIVNHLVEISGSKISIKKDESRFRSSEITRLFGDNSKLKSLGWEEKFHLEDTLRWIYQNQ
jgi:GDP-4-dehydro-6-deoxy-D-mannose reductase